MIAWAAARRRSTRWRKAAHPGWAAFAVPFGSIVMLGAVDGGYYERSWAPSALAFTATAGIGLLVHGCSIRTPECAVISGLGCLALLMLMSPFWGIDGTEASQEAVRCVLYLSGLMALLVVGRLSKPIWLLAGAVAGIDVLVGVALVERALGPLPQDPYEGSLLTGTVGYANALGILAALGVVLAVGLFSATRSRWRRLLLVGGGAASAAALLLTSSRGGLIAMILGIGTLAALRFGLPRSSRGRLLLAAVIVAAIVSALGGHRSSLGDRPAYWHVALRDAAEHPFVGSGAGSFDDVWLAHRPIGAYVRNAHSLYLETAAELGAVGLVILTFVLGAPLVAVAVAPDRHTLAAPAAAYVAFLVHAGLDWDWEMPVTMLAGFTCAAALLVAQDSRARVRSAGGYERR